MKVFAGIPRDDIWKIPERVRWVEEMGYDGINTNEDFSSPFMALTLAAEHTSKVLLGTSVAIVFPISPMTVDYMSWELQKYSKGRFRLGMGSQVKGHIERRFSVPWVPPGPRMREYVLSLKAIWESFQNGTPLRHQGDYTTSASSFHSVVAVIILVPEAIILALRAIMAPCVLDDHGVAAFCSLYRVQHYHGPRSAFVIRCAIKGKGPGPSGR